MTTELVVDNVMGAVIKLHIARGLLVLLIEGGEDTSGHRKLLSCIDAALVAAGPPPTDEGG